MADKNSKKRKRSNDNKVASVPAKIPRRSYGRVTVIAGNCLEATEQYIVHQCNCVTTSAKGFAKQLFDKFPWANEYIRRVKNGSCSRPGTIVVHNMLLRSVRDLPGVINMYSQVNPGRPVPSRLGDGKDERLLLFESCLNHVSNVKDIRSVAFPHGIGCGLAGGDWRKYKAMLDLWASKNPNLKVVLYKLSTT